MKPLRVIIAAAALLAGGNLPAAGGSDWDRLDADQKRLLEPLADTWSSLPAEGREKLARGAARWNDMSEQDRSRAQRHFAQWQALSPAQREAVLENYRRFTGELSSQQQEKARVRWQEIRDLPDEARWRRSSVLRNR